MTKTPTSNPADQTRELSTFAALFVATPLIYALITGHVWEDYLITFRHSRNLADGHGLVYQPGEPPVHGFTSPLGTLLPTALHLLLGRPADYFPALWLFRACSIAAFAGGGLILLRLLYLTAPAERLPRWIVGLLYATEAKSVAFSANGQETGFVLLFLALSFCVWQIQPARMWLLGGGVGAGLMWTRPDGCMPFAAVALAFLVFATAPRWDWFGAVVRMGVVAAVLYGPWIVWTTWYYGSPIPHTVIAKAEAPPLNLMFIASQVWVRAGMALEPIYAVFGGWPGWMTYTCRLLGKACLFWWLIPVRDPLGLVGRRASLAFFLLCCYLALVRPFPWYLPPLASCAILVLGVAPFSLARLTPVRAATTVTAGLAVTLVAFLATVFALTNWQIRIQQKEIEYDLRARIGLFLAVHMKPGDTIFLECLGYIGYYSNGKMLDFPGLVAPEVVAARRRFRPDVQFASTIMMLRPDWLVLRPREYNNLLFVVGVDEISRHYRMAAPKDEFNHIPKLSTYGWIPGNGYLMHDAHFVVLERVR